jgi:arylsulfatase A-like enzyme
MPRARGVVLVVWSAVSPRSLAIYGGARTLPELSALASAGATYEDHRASTSLGSGALASMLTGLGADAHKLADSDARLPRSLVTIGDAAHQGGVVTAFFTANPTTGAPFGFDRGWDTFQAQVPGDETPATKIFDDAARWIDAHKSEAFLIVLHARGGHPPWDATTDDLKGLAPAQYTGGIDPKHAAELLARARHVPPQVRFNDADRARTWALYEVALDAHDAALGRLMAALRAAGRDADTSVIVTSDSGVDEAAHVPFGDGESLDEATLRVPLVVRPAAEPGKPAVAGRRVSAPTASQDVARTVLGALGLSAPGAFGGIDLWQSAIEAPDPRGRARLAVLGNRAALRLGSYVLIAVGAREPKVCDLSLEPACLTDVRPAYPLAAAILQRSAFDALVAPRTVDAVAREGASIDVPTSTVLKSWGR